MKQITLLVTFVLLALTAISQPLAQNLEIYYPFDGNAADSSGNARDGIENNNPSFTTDRFGNPNSALSLDGSNDFIKLANANFMANNEFSLSAWVYLKSWAPSGSQDMLVNLGNTTYDHGLNAANDYLGSYDGFTAFSYNSTTGNAKAYDNTLPVDLNKWYHLVITRDGQKLQFFVNGTLVDNDVINVNPGFTASTSLWIGCRTGNQFFAHANIDEFRAYSRVLSNSEVKQLYDPESNPNPTNTCLNYYFNANYDDSSSNNLHLTNYGGTLTQDRFSNPISAVQLNGSNQYLHLANADLLKSPNLTIGAWVSVTGQPNSMAQGSVVCLGDNTFDHGINFANNYLGTYTGFTGYSYTTPNSNASAYLKSGGNFILNKWYHVAMTRDAGSIRLYIDGQMIDSSAQSNGAGFNTSGNQLWLGARYGNQSFFNGKVDDVFICTSVKTAQEINDWYNQGTQTSLTETVELKSTVFPNPSNGSITIQIENIEAPVQIIIHNSLGQQIIQRDMASSSYEQSLPKAGIYFLSIYSKTGEKLASHKIVVE